MDTKSREFCPNDSECKVSRCEECPIMEKYNSPEAKALAKAIMDNYYKSIGQWE